MEPRTQEIFLELFVRSSNIHKLSELIELLFTKEEINALEVRLKVIKCLIENKYTQRELAQKFKMSISRITRGSNALKLVSEDLVKMIDNVIPSVEETC